MKTFLRKTPLSLSLITLTAGLLSMSATPETSKAIKFAAVYSVHQNDPESGIGSGVSGRAAPVSYVNCDEAPSSVEQQACAQAAYDVSNKKLNDSFQVMLKLVRVKLIKDTALLKSVPDNPIVKQSVLADREIQARILASEHTWTQFREANCNLVAAADIGGSAEGTQSLYCFNTMTVDRIEDLQQITESLFNRAN